MRSIICKLASTGNLNTNESRLEILRVSKQMQAFSGYQKNLTICTVTYIVVILNLLPPLFKKKKKK